MLLVFMLNLADMAAHMQLAKADYEFTLLIVGYISLVYNSYCLCAEENL